MGAASNGLIECMRKVFAARHSPDNLSGEWRKKRCVCVISPFVSPLDWLKKKRKNVYAELFVRVLMTPPLCKGIPCRASGCAVKWSIAEY